jgi:antitoxin VapB
MAIQIANPVVVAKIERLAAETGLSKTAAVDAMLARRPEQSRRDTVARFNAILAQLDRIPDRPDAFEALEWDEHGLPK